MNSSQICKSGQLDKNWQDNDFRKEIQQKRLYLPEIFQICWQKGCNQCQSQKRMEITGIELWPKKLEKGKEH